jgi:Domain of unknown function (DUF4282)
MASSNMETKGFFAALFDFGFTSFITLKFLRVIYAILVCLILLVGVIFLVVGLSHGGGDAVAVIFVAPLTTLLYLIFVRIYMELIAMFFRIGENTSIMAAALAGQAPPPASGYGTGNFGPSGPYGGPSGPAGPAGPAGPTDPPTPPVGPNF